MPTAAKLVGAIAFALTAFLAAGAFRPHLPDGTGFMPFALICTAIGAFCGWSIIGRRAGRGWSTSMGIGITTGAVMTLSAAFLFSVLEMLDRSMNRRYDGPMDALVGTFDILLGYLGQLTDPVVLAVLLGGSVLGGLITEAVGRRWS